MQSAILLSLIGLTSLGYAAPNPQAQSQISTNAVAVTIGPDVGTAIGGAVAPTTTPRPKLNIAKGPQFVTISIINSNGGAISTAHANNAGAPTPVGGQPAPGTIANGATAHFAVPTGWAGNVAIGDASFHLDGSDSLIEANYVVPNGYSFAVADVDISYVDGFSDPIVCSCSGQVVTGCNKSLFQLHSCPNFDSSAGACANPERSNTGVTSATTFFAPCQHAAFTYPNDSSANSFGQCQSGQIVCCVGSKCPANPKQPA